MRSKTKPHFIFSIFVKDPSCMSTKLYESTKLYVYQAVWVYETFLPGWKFFLWTFPY